MTRAYVDTSCLVALAFGAPAASDLAARLAPLTLYSSNLLEAELRAACEREGRRPDPDLLGAIAWVLPARPLANEIARVLRAGATSGRDTWHLACALYLAERPQDIAFMTLDARQAELAAKLGFATQSPAGEVPSPGPQASIMLGRPPSSVSGPNRAPA